MNMKPVLSIKKKTNIVKGRPIKNNKNNINNVIPIYNLNNILNDKSKNYNEPQTGYIIYLNINKYEVEEFKKQESSLNNNINNIKDPIFINIYNDLNDTNNYSTYNIQNQGFKSYNDNNIIQKNKNIPPESKYNMFYNIKISKIMTTFDNNKWPLFSDFKCWHCTYNFNTPPIGIPDKYINDIYYLYGNFCSYNCALAYLYNNNEIVNGKLINDILFNRVQLLYMLFYESNDNINNNIIIKKAPPKLCLKDYGGDLTIEEYRNNFFDNNNYEVYMPPIVPISYHLYKSYNK